MKLLIKGSFDRDLDRVKNKLIRKALLNKIEQIEKANSIDKIIGLKLLRGYSNHFRIHVNAGESKFRIGAVIRGNSIWLVRFLPRKNIYRNFP